LTNAYGLLSNTLVIVSFRLANVSTSTVTLLVPSVDQVHADYREFAQSRDQVAPQSLTYSNDNDGGSFRRYMRVQPDLNAPLDVINSPDGCIFEADYGVPVILVVTELQSESLLVPSLTQLATFL
jgi:hypothetical protein